MATSFGKPTFESDNGFVRFSFPKNILLSLDFIDCCCPGKPEARQHVDQMETQVPEESADATDLDKEMAALEEREHGVEAGARAENRMQQISDHRVEIP